MNMMKILQSLSLAAAVFMAGTESARPAAWAHQRKTCRSRSPPGLSLMLGSSE